MTPKALVRERSLQSIVVHSTGPSASTKAKIPDALKRIPSLPLSLVSSISLCDQTMLYISRPEPVMYQSLARQLPTLRRSEIKKRHAYGQCCPGRLAVLLALGAAHSCALLDYGGVVCWGYNHHGQLGIGSTSNVLANWQLVDLGVGEIAIKIEPEA